MKKVAIIGAGLAGLSASIRLAHAGFKVSVFEQRGNAGGKVNTKKIDGFRFDTGPSLFTMPEVFAQLFEETGGHVTHEKRNPFITAIIGMMPLFGCSFFLFILAVLFSHIGIKIDTTGISLSSTDFIGSFWQILLFAGTTFYENIATFDIIIIIFFILFLYFIGSVAACIAPSGVDLKHSILGMIIIAILGFGTIYLQPLGYIPGVEDHFHTTTPMLDFIVYYLSYAIGIGMIGVFLILLILVPVAMLKK